MIIGTIPIKKIYLVKSENKMFGGKLYKEFHFEYETLEGSFSAYSCDVDVLNKHYKDGVFYDVKLNVANDGTFFIEKIQEIAEQQKLF